MSRFLNRIIFLNSSGEEETIVGGSSLNKPGTTALRDNSGRFQVGDTDVSSTDGLVVVNKNYVDEVRNTINDLDYSDSSSGARKYVSKVTQTDGKIAVEHVNFSDAKATNSSYGFIKTGYSTTNKNYAVKLDTNGNAYVNVPWQDTTYSIVAGSSGTGSSGLIKLSGSSVSSQSQTTKFMREDGIWAAPSYTNIYAHRVSFTAGGYKMAAILYSTDGETYTKDQFYEKLSTNNCIGGGLNSSNDDYLAPVEIRGGSVASTSLFRIFKLGSTVEDLAVAVAKVGDFTDICNIIQ